MTSLSPSRLGLFLGPLVFSAACATAPDPVATDTYVSFGNQSADVVVILAQGGPEPELGVDGSLLLESGLDTDRVRSVVVHQAQTLPDNRFVGDDVGFDEAQQGHDRSVEMLADAVSEYQGQGKRVYVVGVSYGAFIVEGLLATQGNVADGYLIMVGRLDMPDEVWTAFSEGQIRGFEDGTKIVEVPIEEAGMGAGSPSGDRNMARLAAASARFRYTTELAETDLSNLIYVYGTTDEQVGRLDQAEIDFLIGHEAEVIQGDGDHGGTVEEYLGPMMAKLIGEDYMG